MRAVFGLVLVLGLGLAGFAVYMVQGYFEEQEQALARERAAAAQIVATIEVIAVNRSVAYGEQLTTDDLKVVRYAEDYLPEGVFTSAEDLFPRGTDVPRTVLRQMEENEPVLASKVSEPGALPGITSRLAPGMRAFTIPVDVESGVSGFLRPGDRVDVYWSGRLSLGEQSGQEITRLIETGLELIAIDQSSEISSQPARVAETVTVQVSPQQVANLAQAQTTGSLMLSLVGQGDETIATAIEVDQRSLLGIAEEARVIEEVEAPEEVCTVRNRRGSEVVETEIPCTN
ncbi:Flp pilus assembly protein CpaB [Ponticoccus sp. SC2-23]|uniref:Flp pilus assembly protein CpaB n=1 Tax=Alexandriicola marinus TaxID=2081710 RepID=UPI000FDC92DD|nr:Flp pilus assembly protein CpaB [Alexandriicola marinus]MBM1221556.1 Flp pilus assembly protein CpaB [Ponticoccus sp. SC6-9]MBM1226597.1 Flp pilus assembly protein CpaB [Ponticoccus sp. SC6-15]MBM1230548.1 Flp pilus assembly protein CpaB [Ponticoccus sp. SC6-38]MBM1235071.1 Flp pilus assembly protein CpaB [Ponticoccus sp. SC6-45]MBM1239569.1 Flp pilus assembly protein CpaB [Ponticoccus sp. SC6-49]MBM1243351.1 Flp pilus assembly protein CpaB [Ponticoccus sp. SC2-64]MBM1248595.1 Flp pilus a